MQYLYLIKLSSGAPRQRVFRSTFKVIASGLSSNQACARAAEHLAKSLPAGHKAKAESAQLICRTPDDILRDAPF